PSCSSMSASTRFSRARGRDSAPPRRMKSCWNTALFSRLRERSLIRTSVLVCSAALAVALAAPSHAADEDIRALVIRSLRDGAAVPLTGVQVTAVGGAQGRREVVQAIKRKGSQVRLDFLAPLALRGRVLVDDGRDSRLYLPRFHLIEQGESR